MVRFAQDVSAKMGDSHFKPIIDGVWPAGVTLLKLINSDVPAKIAACMAVIWYTIRFYEYIKEKLNGKSGG
jgi:hypothetical protein